ncbi:uncharacterized protein AKAW2_11974A [Aspergillus luchuensis]|nr:uncharacterized protein AKAW2_11974A [Aspergillus luchuensis]BCR94928.1 hypothetical protein AKAW2_11974A [Aspergillus luchuensis]BCS07502.1 hypothetical protein ALUC_11883A [Aspergillus luchuensis]
MGVIEVINNSSTDIYVSVQASAEDASNGASDGWYTLKAHGGSDTWNNRAHWRVVFFTRSLTPGALVETVFGVPGETVNIY